MGALSGAHRRSPGLDHSGDSGASARVTRVGGDNHRRFRRQPEQQVGDHGFSRPEEVSNLSKLSADHVEVATRQAVGTALSKPGRRGCALALRTVPVAAAGIGTRGWPKSSQPSTSPPSSGVCGLSNFGDRQPDQFVATNYA